MTSNQSDPQQLMERALAAAEKAAALGEVPVGAVIAHRGIIIAEAHNLVETLHDAGAHAEMLAIRAAAQALGNWRLEECTLCVTLEPCTMCIGAIRLARLSTVIFGAADARAGATGSLYDLSLDKRLGALPRVIRDVEAARCADVLSKFFQTKRQ